MKIMDSTKRQVSRKIAAYLLAALALLNIGIVRAAAGTSTKTFDFGADGDNPTWRSHSRTFAGTENVAIVVAVHYCY